MSRKLITFEFIVPTVLAIAPAVVLSVGAVIGEKRSAYPVYCASHEANTHRGSSASQPIKHPPATGAAAETDVLKVRSKFRGEVVRHRDANKEFEDRQDASGWQ